MKTIRPGFQKASKLLAIAGAATIIIVPSIQAETNPINPRWSKTGKVGNGRKAKAWGLYDMHGHVAEWVLDTYGPYSAVKDSTDPVSFRDGEEKVIRGGSIAGGYPFMRSAARYSVLPDANYYGFVAFRVVLAPAVKIPLPVTDPETSR